MIKNLLYIYVFIIALTCSTANLFAQSNDWNWAITPHGSSYGVGGIATDSQKNVYVTGIFNNDSLIFGTTVLKNHEKTDSYGNSDVFIAKFDPSGNIIWVTSFGGRKDEYSLCIATDKNDNVYVAGGYDSPVITWETDSINVAASRDMYVVKYDKQGTFQWVRTAKGKPVDKNLPADDWVYSIVTDEAANIYIAGSTESRILDFGSKTIEKETQSIDIFIAKYSTNGDLQWVQKCSGDRTDRPSSQTVDTDGNIYMTGYTASTTINFGDTTVNKISPTNKAEMILAKYDTNGDFLWVKTIGDTAKVNPATSELGAQGRSITTDTHGNIYVTGIFYSQILKVGSESLYRKGDTLNDIFIAKYDREGNVVWAESFGGTGRDDSYGITVDNKENIFVTGSFNSPALEFGNLTVINESDSSFSQAFIVKYDSQGNEVWGYAAGGEYQGAASGIANDGEDVYVSGLFTFPTITFGSTTLNSGFYSNFFFAKLSGNVVSVSELTNPFSIPAIFPNPTNSLLQFKGSGDWDIKIYDLHGRLIVVTVIGESHPKIDLSDKAKGTYIYQLLKAHEIVQTGTIILE